MLIIFLLCALHNLMKLLEFVVNKESRKLHFFKSDAGNIRIFLGPSFSFPMIVENRWLRLYEGSFGTPGILCYRYIVRTIIYTHLHRTASRVSTERRHSVNETLSRLRWSLGFQWNILQSVVCSSNLSVSPEKSLPQLISFLCYSL